MAYITVGTENSEPIQLYYEDHGASTGTPIVLIHGFPLSGAAREQEVAARLQAGYRTITYDRRSFGKSSQPTIGYDYDTFAADLNTLMTHLDLHDAILVGHSMGAGEVTRYLGSYGSGRVRKTVVVAPIPPFLLKSTDNPQGVDRSVIDGTVQSIRTDRFAYLTAFLHDFYNLAETRGERLSDEDVCASFIVASGAGAEATAACPPTWLTDFCQDLAHIDVPLLIIQGNADYILPFLATGKRLHQAVAGSQLLVLGGPHGIPWTHFDEINRALLAFLSEAQPAPVARTTVTTAGDSVDLPAGIEAMRMGDQGTQDTPPPV